MTGKGLDRSAFQALRTARRRARSGPVRISFVDGAGFDRPYVAFVVNRKVGGAVVRNLVRRRLRAISRELGPQLQPGAYLVAVSPEAAKLPYGELKTNVSAAISAIMRQERL